MNKLRGERVRAMEEYSGRERWKTCDGKLPWDIAVEKLPWKIAVEKLPWKIAVEERPFRAALRRTHPRALAPVARSFAAISAFM